MGGMSLSSAVPFWGPEAWRREPCPPARPAVPKRSALRGLPS